MGKYLNMIRQAEKFQGQTSQDKEPVQGQSCPVEARPLLLGDEVTWRPALNPERVTLAAFGLAAFALWTLRSVLVGRRHRRH